MRRPKRQLKALAALNLDLFHPELLQPPAPATLHSLIAEKAKRRPDPEALPEPRGRVSLAGELPSTLELYRLFDRFNWLYFDGRLPQVRIEYSTRMTSAGSFTPADRRIKIGRRYHELFPQDLEDTLKHEMIHILHPRHDAAFKREAKRIGATLKARSHPTLRRPSRYIYVCDHCGTEYPRQKALRQASCGNCSEGGRYDRRFKLRLKWSRKRGEVRRLKRRLLPPSLQ